MFTVRYDLAFDPVYCANVRHPENIWAMLHVSRRFLTNRARILQAIQGHSDGAIEQPRVAVAITGEELIDGKHALLDTTVRQVDMCYRWTCIIIVQMLGIEDVDAPVVAIVPNEEKIVVDESALEKKSSQDEKCDEYLLTDDEEELLNDMIVSARAMSNAYVYLCFER